MNDRQPFERRKGHPQAHPGKCSVQEYEEKRKKMDAFRLAVILFI